MDSKAKSGSMGVLVEQYTKRLEKYLKTGKGKPDQQKFLKRFKRRGKEGEFKTQINIATLLTMQGLAMQKRAEKLIKSTKRIKKAKQEFLKSLKKSGGDHQIL